LPPRAPALLPALALAAALRASPAAAVTYDGTQDIDAFSGLAVGSGRIVGLGGAYVGIAEGMSGIPVNPASAAHRRRDLDRAWDWGGSLSISIIDASQDANNDGTSPASQAKVQLAQLGVGGQWGRLGVGVVARSRLATAPPSGGGSSGVETTDVHVATGWSGLRDALVLGAAIASGQGSLVEYDARGAEVRRLKYTSTTLRGGALWRPRGRPFRLGAAFSPAEVARATGDRTTFPGSPQGFAFPWSVSLGGSVWLGPNAAHLNEPAAYALATHPEWDHAPGWEDTHRQPVLLTAQLDLAGPVKNAVSPESALGDPAAARASGAHPSFVPRLGAEWEGWPDRLRVRAGSYVEPSRTGAAPRAHGTFGAEVRVRVFSWDFQVALSGDVAERYRNVGLSLWLWDRLGAIAPSSVP
jgi:hypothetical protein